MKYIITEERLRQLLKRDELLSILQCAEVDNWYSFEEAPEMCDIESPTEESYKLN